MHIQSFVNAFIGTPSYMAPEMVLGDKMYDGQVDVFSFAILMFSVLSGEFSPYRKLGEGSQFLMFIEYKVAYNPLFRPDLKALPREVPKRLRRLVCQSWNHNPKKRPTFAQIMEKLQEMENDDLLSPVDAEHT